MNRMLIPVLALGRVFAAVTVFAEEPAPGRYAMQKTETGIARLDTQTGEVSLCQEIVLRYAQLRPSPQLRLASSIISSSEGSGVSWPMCFAAT